MSNPTKPTLREEVEEVVKFYALKSIDCRNQERQSDQDRDPLVAMVWKLRAVGCETIQDKLQAILDRTAE